jgi:hypothetical protein
MITMTLAVASNAFRFLEIGRLIVNPVIKSAIGEK